MPFPACVLKSGPAGSLSSKRCHIKGHRQYWWVPPCRAQGDAARAASPWGLPERGAPTEARCEEPPRGLGRNFSALPVPSERGSPAPPHRVSHTAINQGGRLGATAPSILPVSKSLRFIRCHAGFLLFSRLILPSDRSLSAQDFAARGKAPDGERRNTRVSPQHAPASIQGSRRAGSGRRSWVRGDPKPAGDGAGTPRIIWNPRRCH